jgi:DNA-binding response OmpR family regulator
MSEPSARPDPVQHVLIVEDDVPIREILRDLTIELGATPIEARDSSEALTALSDGQRDVHLIILDVMIPGIGGEAVGRAIRDLPNGAKIPILLLSASDPEDMKNLAIKLQARALAKPFDLHELETELLSGLRQDGSS